jgi:hypothetical protein
MDWGYLKSGGMSLRTNGAVGMKPRRDLQRVALKANSDIRREFGNRE